MSSGLSGPDTPEQEHFKPRGTVFVLGVFVAVIILLWLAVYLIALQRGVTT